ncbi:PLP-dependent aminotransferase family protein [Hazenella sp. IB182353]|uniref:MocR-like pyridoxine biosynthesis transcription factor PdxR n=1 Tax=Polycladospora coralii TaxID=2771432 RepID=UPI001747C19C|nr:PLP-dependent aminotransferase family protein [Polycladospora coralii]MBS7529233.1 PLP-dependent aminotransferase family protein [Polycladospora coralii]
MFVTLDRNASISLVDQITLALIERIQSGLHYDGEKLPSVRNLSQNLGVSLLTVVKAYEQLEKKGFIKRHHGKGTFIRIPITSEVNKQENDPFNWQHDIQDYIGRSTFGQVTQKKSGAYPLHLTTLNTDQLPLDLIIQASQQALSETTSIGSYASQIGDPDLRVVISQYLRQWGDHCSPSDFLITSGSQQGIDLIARTFIGPGDVVIMESPTYPGAIDAFRSRGATILTVSLNEEGMQLDRLIQLFDRYTPKLIYTIPTAQNPTGVSSPLKKRRQLLEIAEIYHCLIVEDDPWYEIYYESPPPPPLYLLDQTGHVIYLKGFSKTLSPGLRVGMLAAKGPILYKLLNVKAVSDLCTPLLNQRIYYHLLQEKACTTYFASLRKTLRSRRDHVHQLLLKHAPSEVTWRLPSGGYCFWITLPPNIQTQELIAQSAQLGITLLDGAVCHPSISDHKHIRLSFASLPLQQLEEGIRTLCQVMHDIQSTSLPFTTETSI